MTFPKACVPVKHQAGITGHQAGITWTGSLVIANWIPSDYGAIISIRVGTKVSQEISNQSKHQGNERY